MRLFSIGTSFVGALILGLFAFGPWTPAESFLVDAAFVVVVLAFLALTVREMSGHLRRECDIASQAFEDEKESDDSA